MLPVWGPSCVGDAGLDEHGELEGCSCRDTLELLLSGGSSKLVDMARQLGRRQLLLSLPQSARRASSCNKENYKPKALFFSMEEEKQIKACMSIVIIIIGGS